LNLALPLDFIAHCIEAFLVDNSEKAQDKNARGFTGVCVRAHRGALL
jgi:hypothetical protein